jgi:hypothetical protein
MVTCRFSLVRHFGALAVHFSGHACRFFFFWKKNELVTRVAHCGIGLGCARRRSCRASPRTCPNAGGKFLGTPSARRRKGTEAAARHPRFRRCRAPLKVPKLGHPFPTIPGPRFVSRTQSWLFAECLQSPQKRRTTPEKRQVWGKKVDH